MQSTQSCSLRTMKDASQSPVPQYVSSIWTMNCCWKESTRQSVMTSLPSLTDGRQSREMWGKYWGTCWALRKNKEQRSRKVQISILYLNQLPGGDSSVRKKQWLENQGMSVCQTSGSAWESPYPLWWKVAWLQLTIPWMRQQGCSCLRRYTGEKSCVVELEKVFSQKMKCDAWPKGNEK